MDQTATQHRYQVHFNKSPDILEGIINDSARKGYRVVSSGIDQIADDNNNEWRGWAILEKVVE